MPRQPVTAGAICNGNPVIARRILRCRRCRRRTQHLVWVCKWYEPFARCLSCPQGHRFKGMWRTASSWKLAIMVASNYDI